MPGYLTVFSATGGTAPYAYSVQPGGAGGTIDAALGTYTAPATPGTDTILVTDSATPTPATATATITVGQNYVDLVCDILQQGLGLSADRVYLWNQKITEPSDHGLFIAVSVPIAKPIGFGKRFNGTTGNSDQYVSIAATVDLDIISRDEEAFDKKELVLMALQSDYSDRQQVANGCQIARVSTPFLNLSAVDGAAIPYRYRTSVKMLYALSKSQATAYYSTFPDFQVTPDGLATVSGTVDAGTAPTQTGTVVDGGGASG